MKTDIKKDLLNYNGIIKELNLTKPQSFIVYNLFKNSLLTKEEWVKELQLRKII